MFVVPAHGIMFREGKKIMIKKKTNKLFYALAFFCFCLGLGYLLINGIKDNSVYFLHVSEALAKGTENLQEARLFGIVDSKDIEQKEDSLGVNFHLSDPEHSNQKIAVNYDGAVPDTFQPGAEVIVEGTMQSTVPVFHAHTLMTKCPSKYKKSNTD